eukprot:symbB.v1.2.036201.t1/scaffold5054.1/size31406/1
MLVSGLEPGSGGETSFPHLGFQVRPAQHTAVMWHNRTADGEGDMRLKHEAKPVLAGTKYGMNCFVNLVPQRDASNVVVYQQTEEGTPVKLKLTPPLMETMEATMEATQIPAAETGATEPEAAEVAKPLTLVSPSDEVGFGKHGLMTYEEAWVQEPQYCMWVITTFRKEISEGLEDETSWKEGDRMMKRFAQWLMEKEKNCEAHGPAFEYNADMELVEVPSSRSLRDRVGASQEKKAKFYGVAKPEKRICTSWEECKPFVHGVKGVLYRSFATREEAEAYINNPPAS